MSQFKTHCGNIKMCVKSLKPNCLSDPPKEEKKEAVKPAPAEKPKKEEKKKDEKPKSDIELLPPSNFVLYDFKTFYINHPDKKGTGVDEWY